MSNNKKLNKFVPRSTHYVVDSVKGLVYLTINPFKKELTGEENLFLDVEELIEAVGVYAALEFYKYKF